MEPGIYWYEDLDVGAAWRTPGIVFLDCRVLNQDGEVVQEGQHQLMGRRRPAEAT